jgi:hypothetical protein
MSCPMMCGGLYEPMIRFTTFRNCDVSIMNRANFSFDSWFLLVYSLTH